MRHNHVADLWIPIVISIPAPENPDATLAVKDEQIAQLHISIPAPENPDATRPRELVMPHTTAFQSTHPKIRMRRVQGADWPGNE